MTGIKEAVAPPPYEWPATGVAVSMPDRATVSPLRVEDSIAQRSGVKVACPICRRPERVSVPAGVL